METTEIKKPSFATWLRTSLETYAAPFQIPEGKTEPYIRALISQYNTANNATFGLYVFFTGRARWVATRSDRRNIVLTAQEAPPVAPETPEGFAPGTPLELLKLAVEGFRGLGFGGSEMRQALNDLLTENDDFL